MAEEAKGLWEAEGMDDTKDTSAPRYNRIDAHRNAESDSMCGTYQVQANRVSGVAGETDTSPHP